MRLPLFLIACALSCLPACSSCGQGSTRVQEEGDDAAVRTWLSTWDGGSKKLRVRRGIPAMIDAGTNDNP